jgi:hypothetical protein
MKAVTIREARGQLGELIAQACRGELIVLTDGDKQDCSDDFNRDFELQYRWLCGFCALAEECGLP